MRKLEKIEKELGYCDIKLEKARRARRQVGFLRDEFEELTELKNLLKPHDALLLSHAPDINELPSREAFLCAGVLDLVREKREVVERQLRDLIEKLPNFQCFADRKHLLEDEKRCVMRALSSSRRMKLRRINDEFKRIERVWNELTGDLFDLDEGVFFVDRNLDYLKSARNFLLSAKGEFDLDGWRRVGYLTDLFRHSYIGRTREMVDGADRNIRSAQVELVSMSGFRKSERAIAPGSGSYMLIMIPFMEALYEDLFVHDQIQMTVQVVEAALANNLKLAGLLKAKRENLAVKLERTEKIRAQLFQRMGAGHRSELTT